MLWLLLLRILAWITGRANRFSGKIIGILHGITSSSHFNSIFFPLFGEAFLHVFDHLRLDSETNCLDPIMQAFVFSNFDVLLVRLNLKLQITMRFEDDMVFKIIVSDIALASDDILSSQQI